MRLSAILLATLLSLKLFTLSNGFFGLSSRRREFDDIVAENCLQESPNDLYIDNELDSFLPKDQCGSLYLYRKQRNICRQQTGFSSTLESSIQLGIRSCQNEMKYDHWNCTLGITRRYLLRKPYKEAAFLHSLNAASLVYSFARACSRGQLESSCTCEIPFNELSRSWMENNDWKWGGCGDDVSAAERIVREFANAARSARSGHLRDVDRHNFETGIKVVRLNREKVCKCHGVSGSCVMRTCWNVLKPFHRTTKTLRRKYHSARKITSPLSSSPRQENLAIQNMYSSLRKKHRYDFLLNKQDKFPMDQLIYKDDSPDFCIKSNWTLGVIGRECHPPAPHIFRTVTKSHQLTRRSTCNVVCCGGDYHARLEVLQSRCNCTVVNLTVNCDICNRKVIKYYCT